MQIAKVAVVGAGTMGSSITAALINKGYPVLLKDVDEPAVAAGIQRIERILESSVKRGLPSEEAAARRNLVQTTTTYEQFAEMDLVIEAVAEQLEIKKNVLRDLDENCNVNAILATNTSSLPITQLAAFTRRPDKVVGLHFFNPAHLMKLVEVVAGLESSPDTVRSATEFGQSLGKLAVRVEECPSFLVNRLLGRYMNEALYCLQEGVATVEEIDQAACDYAMPVGPLTLRDMNGADVGLAVAKFNFQEYGERFRAPLILEKMVKQGMLGQKSGGGFYSYDPQTKKRQAINLQLTQVLQEVRVATGSASEKPKFEVQRLFLPMINEAFLALQEKICEAEDLDPAMMAGLGMRKGPLAMAAENGLKECLKDLERYFSIYGERFRPAPLLKRYVWAGRSTVL